VGGRELRGSKTDIVTAEGNTNIRKNAAQNITELSGRKYTGTKVDQAAFKNTIRVDATREPSYIASGGGSRGKRFNGKTKVVKESPLRV